MFSLPSPRSSKLTTSAPALLTLEVAAWNCGAAAHAGSASASTATSAAVVSRILRTGRCMVLLFRRRPRWAGVLEPRGSPVTPPRPVVSNRVGAEPCGLQAVEKASVPGRSLVGSPPGRCWPGALIAPPLWRPDQASEPNSPTGVQLRAVQANT